MDSATTLCSSNKGKINYARLCRLLIVVGKLLLTEVFDKICPPTKLDSVLKDNRTRNKLSSLRKKRVLSVTQWLKLYPAVKSLPVSSRDFDLSLQLLLLTNILDLNVPASCQDNFPPVTDTSPVACFTYIKVLRDRILCHDSSGSVDDATFTSHWSDIANTFLCFGGDHYLDIINNLEKVDFLDEDLWEDYRKQLRKWMGDDASAEHKLGEGKTVKKARKEGDMESSIDISEQISGRGGLCNILVHTESLIFSGMSTVFENFSMRSNTQKMYSLLKSYFLKFSKQPLQSNSHQI